MDTLFAKVRQIRKKNNGETHNEEVTLKLQSLIISCELNDR
jgi:hypothetical protein